MVQDQYDCGEAKSRPYALEVITGPATEPATIGEMRAHLRMQDDSPDSTELTDIWIPAARELIEKSFDLRFISQTVRMYVDSFPMDRYFEIPLSPVTAVSWVKYLDGNGAEQTLDPSVYSVDVKRRVARVCLKPFYFWPFTQVELNAVRVQFVVGWANRTAMPATMRAALLWQARSMYDGEAELSSDAERLVMLNWTGSLDVKT